MSDGIFITRSEYNQLQKDIALIREFVIAQSNISLKNKWVSGKAAMDLLGVKTTKFKELRNDGSIVWRYKGEKRGVEVLLASIEKFKNKTSSSINLKVA